MRRNLYSPMKHLITQYPLTLDYRDRVTRQIGEPLEQVVVSTISAGGYFQLFKFFRRIKSDGVYLPVLDRSGGPLLSPLQILSMLISTRHRSIIEADFSFRKFGPVDAFWGLFRMLWGFFEGAFTLIRDWYTLGSLLRKPRVRLRDDFEDQVVYLKTNLWLGVQAGGSVAHTAGVVQGMLSAGYGVDFVSVESPIAMPDAPSLKFTQVRPKRAYIVPREFNHYRHNSRFYDQALPLLSNAKGLIYQRLSLGNYTGVKLSRRHRLPLVLEYNGSENWLANNWGTPLNFSKLAMRAEDVCLRHAHLVVTVSDVLREELVERGVDPKRIVSFPNGVDAKRYNPDGFSKKKTEGLRERYGIPKDALVVTFVGTFGPWHGAEVFAETVLKMAKENGAWLKAKKLHFMFIGDGARRPNIDHFLSGPEISPFVTITGLIDQMETPLHLAASDIFVSPHVPNPDGSPFFGSPTKLFEYLASGRPVIGSDLNQIAEVLEDCPHVRDIPSAGDFPLNEAYGIRVTPEDVSELAKAINFLAENPDWRTAAGRNARNRALDRYTWDHHVGAILDGLERVRSLEARQEKPAIRLLFNGLHSKSGGGITYLKNILPYLAADKGVDVHLCVHEDQKELLPENLNNITPHYLNFSQGFWNLQLKEQTAVPRLARIIGADVTFSPANYGPILAPNSVILLRNALSVAFVERRPVKLAYWAAVYLATALSLLFSKRAVTVSEYARSAASGGIIGLFQDRLTVIPHGVSEIFSPAETEPRRESYLLAVSDIYVQKNLKNLVYAFSRVCAEHPEMTLKIAGRPIDEDYFSELKTIVGEEKLEGKVEFLGQKSPQELVQLYRRCNLFVFPSTVETFGNPLVEAMACGTPIACSDRAAMPEVVGDAAAFFDPMDLDGMADTISGLLKDEKRRRELGRKAIKRAKLFSWEKTAKRTIDVIKEAANPS